MKNAATESQFNENEFTEIFDGYKAQVNDITSQTERKLKIIAGTPEIKCETPEEERQECTSLNNGNFDHEILQIDETTTSTPGHSFSLIRESIHVPVKLESAVPVPESARIIKEAEKTAKKIITEAKKSAKIQAKNITDIAEATAKKEAKEKVRVRAYELLEQARQESDDIVTQAKEIANREKNEIVATYKARMEQILTDITEQFRKETQLCSFRVINTAKDKADEILSGIRSAEKAVNDLVKSAHEKSHITGNGLESLQQEDADSILRSITSIEAKVEQLKMSASEMEIEKTTSAMDPMLMMHVVNDCLNNDSITAGLAK